MELIVGNQLQLAVSNYGTSFSEKLALQKELLSNQISELENIVNTQCMLTGVNPLSQEMAAGALCVKIGKRPRDLLNPKAIQYMQFIFSIKDAINKKETREIITHFGVTASQVRDFFTSQRAKVRKFIRLSREKVKRTTSTVVVPDGIPDVHDSAEQPINSPVPLDTVAPTSSAEVHSFSIQEEKLSPDVVEAERYFVDNIFSLMRKEETFSGQAKLMDWILQIQNTSVLFWFSVNGGIMILATWLSEAIVEEQTSILHIILKVLCHLPLQKATPVHMSAVLQSVNKLRFYRASDISNRARVLLSKWSKTFANMQAQKRTNGKKVVSPSLDDMLLTQCINEVMGDDVSWNSNGDFSASLEDGSGNLRKLDSSPLKLLTASADDQNKKLITGGRSSQSRERRKVLLVEQPGQRSATRSTLVSRHTTNAAQHRPLSADDIQKAKIRAQFMQSRYGKTTSPSLDENNSQAQINIVNKNAGSEPGILRQPVRNIKVEEKNKIIDNYPIKISNQGDASVDNNAVEVKSDGPPPKKSRKMEIKWNTPPEIEISISWRVGSGENSKENEAQKHRLRREHETIYNTIHEIPSDPKAPWDREMDYDDTLTPQIPVDQLPDDDAEETTTATMLSNEEEEEKTVNFIGSCSQGNTDGPDMELLAELLKNPQLVFALTSGQAGNLSSEETVKLLDMIKKNGVNSLNSLTDLSGGKGKGKAESEVEVSLPSPTPSIDPVTNGRITDLSKNPFSRGKEVVNRPQVLPTVTMVSDQSQQQQPPPLAQHMMISGMVARTQENIPATTSTTNLHQPQPRHLTPTLQRQSPVINSSHYVSPNMKQQLTISELHTRNSHNPHIITPPPPPYNNHLQHSNASQQPLQWRQRQRQGYNHHHPTNDHHQINHDMITTNQAYNQHQYSQDDGRFESWSPDNSPDRRRGWTSSHNYRPDRPVVARNYGQPPPPSGYGDPSWNGGNKRWADRRR